MYIFQPYIYPNLVELGPYTLEQMQGLFYIYFMSNSVAFLTFLAEFKK